MTLAGVLVGACGPATPGSPPAPDDPRVAAGLEQLRDATRPYRSIDSAAAAGYPREVADCLVHEHHGAMGYHHVNRSFVDAKVDLERALWDEMLPVGTSSASGSAIRAVAF